MPLIEKLYGECRVHCPPIYSGYALDTAFRIGVEQGTKATLRSLNIHGEVQIDFINPGDEPLYVSLDKETSVNNPQELFLNLGNDFDSVMFNIVHILKHSEKRKLTLSEVETLRMAQSLVNIVPFEKNDFCDAGQELFDQLETTVKKYEKEFTPKN